MAAFRAMWEQRLGPVIAAPCLRGRARQAGRPIPWGGLSGPVIPATFSGVSDPAPPCATGRSWCGASHRVAVRLQREPPSYMRMPRTTVTRRLVQLQSWGLIDRRGRNYYLHEKTLNSLMGLRSYHQVRGVLSKAIAELTVLNTLSD